MSGDSRLKPNTETPRHTPTPDDYVIRKGGFYYRPNAEGYCSDILEAGRWSRAEALSHQKGVEGVTIHLFRDRYPPLREKARDAEIATLTARIEELETALRFIADGYDNHDVNHLDYRVKVYQVALDVLQPKDAAPLEQIALASPSPIPEAPGVREAWHPIETAPKDGTEILGWWSGGKTHTIVSWSGDGWWKDSADDSAVNSPTHWQNLPDGPALKPQDGGESGR